MTETIAVDKKIIQTISPEVAWHYHIIPIQVSEEYLHFAVDETSSIDEIKNELTILFGTKIELIPKSREMIVQLLNKYYLKAKKGASGSVGKISPEADDFADRIIEDANELGSSDIHIEKYENRGRIRFRIDGQLVERYAINASDFPSLVNKIKIKANLDISEKRLPQDGRINYHNRETKFDIRVSSLPTLYGEKIVLRILGSDASHLNLSQLGFNDHDLTVYQESIKKPNGIILISGPTGSGKTTTLYGTLKELNVETKNILTIEDPIEYTLPGINQVQLKESIGMNFGTSLRTFLRQDPDIIMVGEIRDPDTANMAIRAALTGHLVLSTIHTNSAWGTISRLIDMGIPAYLLSNTLILSIAQRLIRKLCEGCKKEASFSDSLYPSGYNPEEEVVTHFKATGCDRCFHTGYSGRQAIYEVIPINSVFAEKIRKGEHEVGEELKKYRVATLSEGAFRLFKSGITSLEEVYPLL